MNPNRWDRFHLLHRVRLCPHQTLSQVIPPAGFDRLIRALRRDRPNVRRLNSVDLCEPLIHARFGT